MPQPLVRVPYTRPLMPGLSRVQQLIEEVWKTGILTNFGPKEQEFETKLQPVLGGVGVLGVSSGYTALRLILSLLEPNGEVIVSGFTHAATVQAVYAAGFRAVFADIGPDLNIAPASVDAVMTSQTRAIMATHTFGNPADVLGLQGTARKHGVALLFDAAGAVGVRFNGLPLGDYGTASAFSFHATKILSTTEGGAVVTTSMDALRTLRQLSNFGIRPEGTANPMGMNAKLNEVSSAIGIASLEVLPGEIIARAGVRAQYECQLSELEEIEFVKSERSTLTVSNNAYVPIRLRNNRNKPLATNLNKHLRSCGIESRRYFDDQYSVDMGNAHAPRSREARNDTLCLPIWGAMPLDDISTVCIETQRFIRSHTLEGGNLEHP